MSTPELDLGLTVVTLLNTVTGDIQSQDDIVAQPLTLSQRARVREQRESEWEAFCDAAPCDAELSANVRAHVTTLLRSRGIEI